jgi:hypothetical protein
MDKDWMQQAVVNKLTNATADINCNCHVHSMTWSWISDILFLVLQHHSLSSACLPSVWRHLLCTSYRVLACRHHVQPMSVSKLARRYATNNLNSGHIRQNSKYVYVCRENVQQCTVCCGVFYRHHAAVCCCKTAFTEFRLDNLHSKHKSLQQ